LKKLSIISLIFLFISSCRDIENCSADDNTQNLIISFFDIESPQSSEDVFYSFQAEGSLIRFVLDTTSFVFQNDTTVFGIFIPAGDSLRLPQGNIVSLPLNPLEDLVTYYFYLPDNSVPDTLSLSYKRAFSIFDPECPASLTFTEIDTIKHTFDSLVISNSTTNILLNQNIEIYL